ncbi:MAG TPA: type II toxin-antitoxin system VapC family toxin [Aeromicrobium sp.]|nr:type II toxin-antitoxin system VapC family toxin [Aeromicrobium sp.]
MRVFADSSAVVKIYADKVGSDRVRGLAAMYVAEIVRVEVVSAFWRKARMGDIDPEVCARLVERFEDDLDLEFGPLVAVSIDRGTLKAAARLAGIHGLRAYDAVQLASALTVRSIDADCQVLATYDRELLAAAQREDFLPLLNV